MERLTSNKKVSEMGIYELAHNSCYTKQNEARVRDFENDFEARELTIKLIENYVDIPNEFTCDDDFDDFMMDALKYGTDSILGLIAVFYKYIWAMANLRERLKEYEDLEEQGKLLKLPCAVGDTVYAIHSISEDRHSIYDFKINALLLTLNAIKGEFGKNVFITREEAEAALKELTN